MMQDEEYVAASSALPAGTVIGHDKYAVGNNGEHFAVSRRCRHLRADLAEGSIDSDGCLVCPWHGAAYDVDTGRMVRGPGGVFAKIPGLGVMFKTLTHVVPLERRQVIERVGDLYLKKN
jgi:nitrite reductase/ring-hydroxylating ferredoxin subunit